MKYKICSKCGNKQKIKKGNVCSKCHYQKYRQSALRSKKQVFVRNKTFVIEYKKSHPCTFCGEPDYRVLQFHHLRDKKIKISRMVSRNYSIKAIKKEINKCIILCANCHMREHYE